MQRIGVVILTAALVGGCAAPGPIQGDTFYRLPLPANTDTIQPLTNDLVYVAELQSEGIQSERAILYSSDNEAVVLDQYHYHFWAASPGRIVRDHLVDYLVQAAAADRVVIDPVTAPDLTIRGRVQQLLHVSQPNQSYVIVALQLRLEQPERSRPLLVNTYREQLPVGGNAMEAVVRAMAEALENIYDRFLQDASQAVSG
jgi:ABC-type uncharacterized transport system auxiliary subunit